MTTRPACWAANAGFNRQLVPGTLNARACNWNAPVSPIPVEKRHDIKRCVADNDGIIGAITAELGVEAHHVRSLAAAPGASFPAVNSLRSRKYERWKSPKFSKNFNSPAPAKRTYVKLKDRFTPESSLAFGDAIEPSRMAIPASIVA